MAEERAQRRLAAILAADVVGYSRLMEADEAGTLAGLKSRQRDVLEPLVAQHRGRIVKLMGDGALVEFASAVNAVQCAVDLQERMAEANADLPSHRAILGASASTWVTSLLMASTSKATASMLRRGWRRWPNLAESAYRPVCSSTRSVGSR